MSVGPWMFISAGLFEMLTDRRERERERKEKETHTLCHPRFTHGEHAGVNGAHTASEYVKYDVFAGYLVNTSDKRHV